MNTIPIGSRRPTLSPAFAGMSKAAPGRRSPTLPGSLSVSELRRIVTDIIG